MMQEDVVSQAMSAMAAEKSAAVDVSAKKEPDLKATGLVKIYGDRPVVNGMDVSCSCGEIVGLLGPNGAGKTTTFYMVVGLVKPDGGKVEFRGKDLTHMPVYLRARNGLGYLAQEASVFRKLSVWDNVMAILETLPMSRKERKARRNCRTAPSTRCCSPETSGDSEFLSRPGRLLHTFTCRRCKRHTFDYKIISIVVHFTLWIPAFRSRPIVSNFYVAVQSDICRIVTGVNTQHRTYR